MSRPSTEWFRTYLLKVSAWPGFSRASKLQLWAIVRFTFAQFRFHISSAYNLIKGIGGHRIYHVAHYPGLSY